MSSAHHRPLRRVAAAVTLAVVGTVAGSCTNSTDGQPNAVFVTTTATTRVRPTSDEVATTIAGGPVLEGLCPDPLVVQLDGPLDLWALPWTTMLAIDGDAASGSYRAEMVHPFTREPLGIRVELRPSVPPGKSVAQVLRDDRGVHVGVVSSDLSIPQRAQAPITYLAAPWLHDDRILYWDTSLNPDALSLADLSLDPDVTLSGTVDDPVVAYLVGTNLITRAQLRTGPAAVQFGNFLDDPTGWLASDSTRRWQFLTETGWSPYPHAIATSASALTLYRDCFEALVPLLQRSVVEIEREPERMLANLGEIAGRSGATLDLATTRSKLRAAIDNGLLNTVDSQTVGEVTAARIEQALRADATSSRVRGLPAASANRLRQRAKSIIMDFTVNDLEVPTPE